MFWDGSRWVDETPKPTASQAPRARRWRDWGATSVIGLALVALIIPSIAASAATGTSSIAAWSTSYSVTSYQESNFARINYDGRWSRIQRHPQLQRGGSVRSSKSTECRNSP